MSLCPTQRGCLVRERPEEERAGEPRLTRRRSGVLIYFPQSHVLVQRDLQASPTLVTAQHTLYSRSLFALMSEPIVQIDACLFIRRKGDAFSGHPLCFSCKQAKSRTQGNGGVSKMTKDDKNIAKEQCAFKGMIFLSGFIYSYSS